MNVLILAAGEVRGDDSGYPIWLSELDGEILLERQVKALALSERARVIFAFRSADITTAHVDDIARQIAKDCAVISVKNATAGAACTALLAIDELALDDELIIVSATDHIDVDYGEVIDKFRSIGADAGILTFDSLHPRYSFVLEDEAGWVTEAAEKRPISRHANAGFYWYAKASHFVESVRRMVLKDAHVGGVFYLSPALNEMVLQGHRVATWRIPAERYHPLKDQRQFQILEHQWEERKRHAS